MTLRHDRKRLLFILLIGALASLAATGQAQEAARPMEYGQTVEGNLDKSAPSALYAFRGQQGDAVVITMDGNDFDAYLNLIAADESELAWDDGSLDPDAHIGPYVLPETGEYQVRAASVSGSDTGSYVLRVEKLEAALLQIGQSVNAEVSETGAALYYAFDAKTGDVVNIAVKGDGTLDTRLRIRGSEGYDLAYDDDSGGDYNPLIRNFITPQDGRYIAVIEPYAPGLSGKVKVSLTASKLLSLDEGAQSISMGDKRPEEVVVFTGRAGERVRMKAAITAGEGPADYLTLTVLQGGETLTSASGNTLDELSFAFTVRDSGDVMVRVECYANVVLDVSVERLEG